MREEMQFIIITSISRYFQQSQREKGWKFVNLKNVYIGKMKSQFWVALAREPNQKGYEYKIGKKIKTEN
jgi:hypothetical protein